MIYRQYGSTGKEISAIAFGGMRFQADDNPDTCAELMVEAYEKGINYFDTAPGYPRSEEIFGIAIKQMKKNPQSRPFHIATKTMKTDIKEINTNLENSLKRMDIDCIDFYHVWCVMSLSDYNNRKTKGVLKEFEKFKEQGLVKHICVSTHANGEEIENILKDYPFDGMLVGYSAMNFPYRELGLTAAAKRNMAVVTMNPLGGGLIPANPERFSFLKTEPDQPIVDAAIKFLLNDSRITAALVGLSNTQQLDQAIAAADTFKPLPEDKTKQIKDALPASFDKMCTSCGYCDLCPKGINVPRMMDVYNQYMLSGKTIDLINRYRYHWELDLHDKYIGNCIKCGHCEKACTQKLPIIERLEQIQAQIDKFNSNSH